MANLLARGVRVSLSVPALANLYRSLRYVTSCRDPSYCTAIVPFHWLSGWIYAHWPSYYTPVLPASLRADLPTLAAIAGAEGASPEYGDAYLTFAKGGTPISLSGKRPLSSRDTQFSNREIRDLPGDEINPVPFLARQGGSSLRDAERVIARRMSVLPLRQGGRLCFEMYFPHRAAHQFGYDQHVADSWSLLGDRPMDLSLFADCWRFLLRLGTGSIFTLAPTNRVPTMSARFANRHRELVSAHFMQKIRDIRERIFPTKPAFRSSKRVLNGLQKPPDFLGFDGNIEFVEQKSGGFILAHFAPVSASGLFLFSPLCFF